ncbi:hypothetical protein DdX_15606 [Ditylenchus destructor]|uniref:Uncharacterized protein n=1 Tax=Ditylenchus destructor TaxID=166010 RepID=A0AAD4QXK6_9BILA|nr:hypothetical protein DdX_15606 [Ditylenchus destructor]
MLFTLGFIALVVYLVDHSPNVNGQDGFWFICAAIFALISYLFVFCAFVGRPLMLVPVMIATVLWILFAARNIFYFCSRFLRITDKLWIFELGQIFDEKQTYNLHEAFMKEFVKSGVASYLDSANIKYTLYTPPPPPPSTPAYIAGLITVAFVGFLCLQLWFFIIFRRIFIYLQRRDNDDYNVVGRREAYGMR